MNESKLKGGTFTGDLLHSLALENYIVSITEHHPNLDVPKHSHENSYISLLLHGFYNETSCISEQRLIPGTSLFRPDDYEHQNEIGPSRSLCFNLEIKKDIFKDALFRVDDSYIKFEHNCLEILSIYLAYKRNFSNELLNLSIEENTLLLFGRGKIEVKTRNKQWVNSLKKQVQSYPELTYSIDQVANTVNLHPVYFVKKFKQHTGYTFGEFLIRQRLSKAIDLMHDSNKSLTEVALDSGFYDQSHFIKRFKEVFQITPTAYLQIVKS